MQEAKRKRVSDLLRTHVTYSEITRITGASSKTILKVKKSLEARIDLKAPRRGGKAQILTEEFLEAF